MTGEAEVAPDPFIQTALQLLPVPDHGPEFWARLDAVLAEEPAGPPRAVRRDGRRLLVAPDAADGTATPALARAPHGGPDAALALVPVALRRPANLVPSAVAVAAAVMVVVAGTALVRQRAGDDVDATDAVDEQEASDRDGAAPATSIAALSAADAAPSTDAVLAWVTAVGTGDTDTAWDGLGPASQAHFGSASAFEAARTELAEGYGAWAAASPDDVLVMPLSPDGEGQLLVVTLVGAVAQEGTRARRATAFPVRVVDGTPRVEPFAFAGELELVVPEASGSDGSLPVVQRDEELVVVVPRGVEAPMLRLDDGEALICGEAPGTELTELDDAPGQRCSYQPEGGLDAGARVLTVAFLAPDGAGVAAESVLFEAA